MKGETADVQSGVDAVLGARAAAIGLVLLASMPSHLRAWCQTRSACFAQRVRAHQAELVNRGHVYRLSLKAPGCYAMQLALMLSYCRQLSILCSVDIMQAMCITNPGSANPAV